MLSKNRTTDGPASAGTCTAAQAAAYAAAVTANARAAAALQGVVPHQMGEYLTICELGTLAARLSIPAATWFPAWSDLT